MIKKLLALSLMATSSVSFADEGIFCNDIEKISTEGYGFNHNESLEKSTMCLTNKEGQLYLNEHSYIYGVNEYKVIDAPTNVLKNVKKIENISGKLLLTTKNNELYTADLGYILNNNDYLPLNVNNKIKLVKEDVKDVKKVVYSDIMLVLTQDNKVMIKTEEGFWERAPFKKVIDITYTNYGSYFVLTKNGVFAKLKERDLQKTGYKGKGSLFRFDKAGLGKIPLNDLRFDFVDNDNSFRHTTLELTNAKNKNTYKIYLLGSKAYFNKQPESVSIEAVEKMESSSTKSISPYTPIVEAENIEIGHFEKMGKSFSDFKNYEVAVYKTNKILTRYNEWVTLSYKEKVALTDRADNWLSGLPDYKSIVSVKEDFHQNLIYVLRSNGELRTYDRLTLLLVAQDVNVKSLILEEDTESIQILK